MKQIKNNKGFTMLELLATVTILGILTTLAIQAYGKYIYKTEEKAYDFLASSAISATEEYLMDHQNITEVDIDTLVEKQYLESAKDPGNKERSCTGTVKVAEIEATDLKKLDKNEFIVNLCCSKKNIKYTKDGKQEIASCDD